MSLESARKLGLTASLISVIMPIAAIIGVVAYVVYIFATVATRIQSGTALPIFGAGFTALLVAVAVVGVIGFIMFMVAMHRLSIYYNEPSIFRNILYAFIISIISGIVLVILEFTIFASLLTGIPQTGTPTTTAPLTQFFVTYFIVIGVSIIFGVVNAVLYMRAFNRLAEKSGVDDFKTTGLLYLLGTVLTIALIGGLLVWIAWIYAAMGFKKLKSRPPPPTFTYQTQPPLFGTTKTKRCLNCGTENIADSLYCRYCGKPLQ